MSSPKDSSLLRKQLPTLRTTDAPMPNAPPTGSRAEHHIPESSNHDKSHLNRRLHTTTLRNRAFTSSKEHTHRHRAKETVQSAIELRPPISFDSLLRREKKSSPPSSRRDSPHQRQQQQVHQDATVGSATQQDRQARPRKIKAEDVKKAREQNERRDVELRESLKSVEEAAMSGTRQLDDAFYSILEKISILRSTVASLQLLAEESRRMHSTFNDETAKLAEDTKRNLNSFGNFDGQEKTITGLVNQLKDSKDKTNRLNDRLEAARNRIEAYEEREKEKEKQRRKNMWMMWGTLVGFLVLIFALWTAKHRSTVGTRIYHVTKVLDELGHEIASPITAALRPSASPIENPYLNKLFDDL